MNAETRQALAESITHWERVVAASEAARLEPLGPSNCALCARFNPYHPGSLNYPSGKKAQCHGCPVRESGPDRNFCAGTPYDEITKLIWCNIYHGAAFTAAAQAELAFLKSLLPE